MSHQYNIEKLNSDKYVLREVASNNIIKVFKHNDRVKISILSSNLADGNGFDGWTPAFIGDGYKYSIPF
jgi:hypothetical protein